MEIRAIEILKSTNRAMAFIFSMTLIFFSRGWSTPPPESETQKGPLKKK